MSIGTFLSSVYRINSTSLLIQYFVSSSMVNMRSQALLNLSLLKLQKPRLLVSDGLFSHITVLAF